MLVSTYHLSDTERANARRQWIAARPFVIGRARDCDVVVDDPDVADHHLRITERGPEIVVENLAAAADVDGTPLAAGGSLAIDQGRPIRIGGTIVKLRLQAQPVVTTVPRPATSPPRPPIPANRPPPIVMTNPPEPYLGPPGNPPAPRPIAKLRPRKGVLSNDETEQRFLVALRANPGDAETRMVYADWLEGHGKNAKAQLVRLREHLDTFMHRSATELDWRVVAVRTPIERCARDRCPGGWDALAPFGDGDFVRRCDTCQLQVRYCGDRSEAQAAGYDGVPVVFDAALDRVAAHAAYRDPFAPITEDDEIDDDPDGYTLDAPPAPFRR